MAQLYKNDVPILTAGSKSITVQDLAAYNTIYDGGTGTDYDPGAVYYIAASGSIKKGNIDYGSRATELTMAQYLTLYTTGTVTVDGVTYTYNPEQMYFITDGTSSASESSSCITVATEADYEDLLNEVTPGYDEDAVYFIASSGQIKKGNVDYGSRTMDLTKAQYDALVADGSVVINGKTIVYDNYTTYFITDYTDNPPTQPCYKYLDFTPNQVTRSTTYSTIIIHNETNHGILAPLATIGGGTGTMAPLYVPPHKYIKVVAELSDCICPDGTLLYSRDGGEIYIYNYRDYRNDAYDIGLNYMTVTDKWNGTTKIKVNIGSLCVAATKVHGGSQVYIMPSIWSTSIGPSGYITAYTTAADLLNLKMYVTNNDVTKSTLINITSASISGSVSSGADLNLNSGVGVNAGVYIDASDCSEATNIGNVNFELSPLTQSGGGPQTQYKILAFREEQVTPA